MPTKTEQSDLYQAVYGRNGDAPMPVIAARQPADAFEVAIEAVRIATQYMTPVMLLTDGYIANAAEPWKVPDGQRLRAVPGRVSWSTAPAEGFQPYARDDKLARPWVKPGTPGLLHRIGGIEKALGTGNIDYSPANHQAMTDIRQDKVAGIDVPDQEVELGEAARQAGGRRLGFDLRPDPSGGAPRAPQGARRQPYPHPPHLADAEESRRVAQGLRA